jgi:predicted phage terminase large subunit-like protein
LICDDVVAHGSLYSKADRDRTAAAFFNNLMNLLEPDGRCWCLCTPWHRDDLNARLKANPAFAHFRRAVGPDLEPVWPEKWGSAELAKRRTLVGEAAFARGYRLVPFAEEDAAIQPGWITTWAERPEQFDEVVLAVDPAVTAGPDADASALVVVGRTANDVYCLEASARRVRTPDLVQWIEAVDARWAPTAVAFESNSAFRGIADLLQRHTRFGPRVVPVNTGGKNKIARVAGFSVYVQSGAFKLKAGPNGQIDPSQQELWDQMTTFPGCPHDDLVDAAAMGTEQVLKNRDRPEPRIWIL